jgi:hypothetical protein
MCHLWKERPVERKTIRTTVSTTSINMSINTNSTGMEMTIELEAGQGALLQVLLLVVMFV